MVGDRDKNNGHHAFVPQMFRKLRSQCGLRESVGDLDCVKYVYELLYTANAQGITHLTDSRAPRQVQLPTPFWLFPGQKPGITHDIIEERLKEIDW